MEQKLKITLDGLDGTGKTTVKDILLKRHSNLEIIDRGILTKLTLSHWSLWDKNLNLDCNYYILFEADHNECHRRLLEREMGIIK